MKPQKLYWRGRTGKGQNSIWSHGGQVHQDFMSHFDPIWRQMTIVGMTSGNEGVKDSEGAVVGEDFERVITVDIDNYSIDDATIAFNHFTNQTNNKLFKVKI